MVVHIYKDDKRADQTHGRFHEAEEALAKKKKKTTTLNCLKESFRSAAISFFFVCGDCLMLRGLLTEVVIVCVYWRLAL